MRLTIEKVEPGMEVMSDVFNVNKMLLLPKGVVITERHLKALKTWGVEHVNVLVAGEGGTTDTVNQVLPPEMLSAAEKRVAERFRHTTQVSPAIQIVKRLALRSAVAHFRRLQPGNAAGKS